MTRQSTESGTYLPALDGLRALAVTSVVTYHIWASGLPGGFTGVDVFFVISGYIVTRSTLSRQYSGIFDLLSRFYAKRFLRIAPALIVVIVVTALLSIYFIPIQVVLSDRYLRLCAVSAVFGFSNFVLLTDESGYFGSSTEYNPFAHTWSLGIEEQFYLIFPFIIYFYQRRLTANRSTTGPILLVVGASVLSFFVFVATSWFSRPAAFYLFPGRFWEIGAGMALCLVLDQRGKDSVQIQRAYIGPLSVIAILLLMMAFVRPQGFLPLVPHALPAVLGTLLAIVIALFVQNSTFSRFLSMPAVVAVGRRSYSIYLWHWPVVVIFRWTIGLDTLPLRLSAVAISLALAAVSYAWIEQPARKSKFLKAKKPTLQVLALSGAMVVGAIAAFSTLSLHERISPSVTRNRSAWAGVSQPPLAQYTHCKISADETTVGKTWHLLVTATACERPVNHFTVFAIGDSHNRAYQRIYRQLSSDLGVTVRSWSEGSCATLGLDKGVAYPDRCRAFESHAVNEITRMARPGDVIFLPGLRIRRFTLPFGLQPNSSDSPPAPQSMIHTAHRTLGLLVATGANVVVEAPTPVFAATVFRCMDWFNSANTLCRNGLSVERAVIERRRSSIVTGLNDLVRAQPAATIWDPLPILCPGVRCDAIQHGKPIFIDGDHLSGFGNDLLYPSFRAAILAARQGISAPAKQPGSGR